MLSPLPIVTQGVVAVGFKEWAGVCARLGSGQQSLILRKGGISEGADGFRPEHQAFWLYPTFVHEAQQGLRSAVDDLPAETPGVVDLTHLAVVDWFTRVSSWDRLKGLEPYHDWIEATLRTRFDYRTPGLWAIVVRVYRRVEPWPVAITSAHLGCKTWVPLENPPVEAELRPVLGDAEAAQRLICVQGALGCAQDHAS